MTISAVILTKNEEKNIVDCLKSVSWCDEIIVIDDNSADETRNIAKKHNAIVFKRALNNNFASQRNFGLQKAKGDWILFVDADERVPNDLKEEIESKIKSNNAANGFYIKRQDSMWGKVLQHGEQGDGKFLRLVKKELGKWEGAVHEIMVVKGSTLTLENPLYHFPHPTLSEFLAEINFYSTLRARQLHEKGIHANLLSVLLYPKAKFLQDYFLKLGFLDGIEGFIVAIIMSMHSFLTRGKLWQLTKK